LGWAQTQYIILYNIFLKLKNQKIPKTIL